MGKGCWQIVTSGGRLLYVVEKSPTIVGRDYECDVMLSDDSVSRRHAQINIHRRVLTIHDLESVNGTWLNGNRLKSAKVKAYAGQSCNLRVGTLELKLNYGPLGDAAGVGDSGTGDEEDAACWFYTSTDQEYGPVGLAQLFGAVDRGELRPTDEVWQVGMDYRLKAFEVEGLFETQVGTPGASGQEQAPYVSSVSDIGSVICPYCWQHFEPEDVLFIASHPDLLGDPVLGPEEGQRFLPTRFTAHGLGVDAAGIVCPDMACPSCHMRLPSSLVSHRPLFMSVVGGPGSGKSYFFASSTWTLRTTLPKHFGIGFTDVDALSNHWLNDYEAKLFFQANSEQGQVIAKTDMQAPTVYRQVKLHNMDVSLPLPSLFALRANGTHPLPAGVLCERTLVLYDHAGEHFQAGNDSAATPGTRHLVHAEGILILFDPTVDPRFHSLFRKGSLDKEQSTRIYRQDVLLVEMVGRVRKHLGLSNRDRLKKTIMVGISKADLLDGVLPDTERPWRMADDGSRGVLDLDVIAKASDRVRSVLDLHAPEIVATAEGFAENVVYLPNSALGHNPSGVGVRPCDIAPKWVDVPLLCVLARLGYVATVGHCAGVQCEL